MNLQENILRIKLMMNLNESDKNKIWLLRRLETQDIKYYLNEQIDSLTDQISPCGNYLINIVHLKIIKM
jgi:hypothetical protein